MNTPNLTQIPYKLQSIDKFLWINKCDIRLVIVDPKPKLNANRSWPRLRKAQPKFYFWLGFDINQVALYGNIIDVLSLKIILGLVSGISLEVSGRLKYTIIIIAKGGLY